MILPMVAATLGFAAGPPALSLCVEPPETPGEGASPQIAAWVAGRLLEDGAVLVPESWLPDRVVRLWATPSGLEIEIGEHHFEIEAGPPAVMQLELRHHLDAALFGVGEGAADLWPGVVVQWRGPGVSAGELLRYRLLRAGFALRAEARASDVMVCAEQRDGETIVVHIGAPGHGCEGPTFTLHPIELEWQGGITGVASAVLRALVGPPERDAPGARPLRYVPPPPNDPFETDELELGLDGGAMIHGAIDGSLRTFARIGFRSGLGAHMQLSVSPTPSRELQLVATTLMAGPDVAVDLRKRGRVTAGLLVGAEVDAFRNPTVAGFHVYGIVGVPLTFSYRLTRRLRVHATLEGDLALGSRELELSEAVHWRRTTYAVRMGVGFSYVWGIQ